MVLLLFGEAEVSLTSTFRNQFRKLLTRESSMVLANRIPDRESLERKFQEIGEFGLYLHIPFCRQICPYCPYNKEIYHPETARKYASSIKKEIDFYSSLLGKRPVTSFYIGGGTPTTMLTDGLGDVLEHVFKSFNMQCEIHMESHPNDLNPDNLQAIKALDVKNLSMGVEALQDKYLSLLKRPYTVAEVKKVIERVANNGFKCFNVDFIFALPGQTYGELEQAAGELAGLNIDQVAAYPLFYFPYTQMGGSLRQGNYSFSHILRRKRMLKILENTLYPAATREPRYGLLPEWGFPNIAR